MLSKVTEAIKTVGGRLKELGMDPETPVLGEEDEVLRDYHSEVLKIVEARLKEKIPAPSEVVQPQPQGKVQEPRTQEPLAPKTPVRSRLPVPKSLSGSSPKKFT